MSNTNTTFESLFGAIGKVLNAAIPLLFAAATVCFLYGLVKYLSASGNEDKMSEGRKYIIYGIIGLFIMLAMWGLVNAAARSLLG